MKEDHYHLIRWGVPGWSFIFFTFLFLLINNYVVGSNPDIVDHFYSIFSDHNSFAITIIIGSSIPIGFLIYQIHHYIWWNLFYIPSEWTIDFEIMPQETLDDPLFKKILGKMRPNDAEKRRIRIWSRLLAFIPYILLPHLWMGTRSLSRRIIGRMRDLSRKRKDRNQWELLQVVWQRKNSTDEHVQRENYTFGSLGTITFSLGGAFVIFVLIKTTSWTSEYTKLIHLNLYIYNLPIYNMFIYLLAALMIIPLTSLVFLPMRKLVVNRAKDINRTTSQLVFFACLLFAEYFGMGGVNRLLVHHGYPINFEDVTALIIPFIIVVIFVAVCRGNRRNIIKGRNLLIAYDLHAEEASQKEGTAD